MSTVAILACSSGKNLELSHAILQQLEHVDAEVIELDALQLPLYTVPLEKKNGVPDTIAALADRIRAFDGMVFCAPEYNGGIPPVLNNFIAWMSRSGSDWRACFNGKTALLANFSSSGGPRCLGIMRNQLAYIGLNVMGRELHATASRAIDPTFMAETLSLFETNVARA